MTQISGMGGHAIRSAGKTTIFLQAVAAFLTLVLVGLYADISRRYSLLEDGIRENATWSVYQVDRESRTLDSLLRQAVAAGGVDSAETKELTLRYDILYSRVKLLHGVRYDVSILDDEVLSERLRVVQDAVYGQASLFDRMAEGYVPPLAEIQRLAGVSAQLIKATEKFLLDTNRSLGEERAQSRKLLMQLQQTSAVMLGLLLLSVLLLVVTLRRQLRSMREASLSLEIMAQELSDAYKAADAGNRAKSQFMATMGHEIRTPLNAILGTAELLEYSRLPAEASASVQTIRSSGEALLEIINEILDYSKIESGKLELEMRDVDIVALTTKTVDILSARAAEHQNRLVLDIQDQLAARHVRTDPTRLRQVLLNLLSNAVKFTDKGTVTVRLREFTRNSQPFLRFEVEDTGIGIDDAGRAKLFKPFSQVDASISRKYGGTGLGLTICKQIVETLGGELDLRSRAGVGSTFWFEIPVLAVQAPAPAPSAPQVEAISRLPRGRILLVEDNKVNQQVATRFLTKLGQEVTVANNGLEAVEIAAANRFDVILMDMQMPVMDGIEATRRIRAADPEAAPIIAMTANASDDDRRRCVEAGMVGFESKPVTLARLYAVLADRLEDRETEGAEAAPFAAALPDRSAEVAEIESRRRQELVDVLGEDGFEELIAAFFGEADGLVEELQLALASEDPKHIDRVLHTIKGAAANVGLSDIAEIAEEMRDHLPTIADVEALGLKINSRRLKLVA